MTISSTTRKAGPYTGNDVADAFTFDFKVFAGNQVAVVRAVIATGEESTLTLTTDYTVTLNANQDTNPGGTVTTVDPLASAYTLTLASAVPYSQSTTFTNTGGFYPAVLNAALDRQTILSQQLLEQVDRALKLPLSAPTGTSATLPAPVASAYLGWDATGTYLVNYTGFASVGVSVFMTPIVALTNAADVRTALGVTPANIGAAAVGANADITSLTALASVPTVVTTAINASVASRMQYSLTATVATTSGTAVDFTSIPSWAKRITVMLAGVSTNGSSALTVQIGSGSIDVTGYEGSNGYTGAASAAGLMTNGFGTETASAATVTRHGHCTLTHMGSNVWAFSSVHGRSDSNYMNLAGGSKALSGVLDRIRLTATNLTDAFDAGTVSVLIEG